MNTHRLNWRQPAIAAAVLPALMVPFATRAFAADTVWVSALDLKKIEQDAGKPGVNSTVDGKPISIAGQKFDKGVGTQAPSVLYVDLKKGAQRFSASVGIDDGVADPRASVEFQVYGDKKLLWRSGIVKAGQAAKNVDVDVTGVSNLMLLVSDGGDGNTSEHAVWADAKLQVTGAAPETTGLPATEAVILTPKPASTPRVNGPKIFGVRPGSPFLYTIPATGQRPMTFSAIGLPAGLALDSQTGRITGSLKTAGEYRVTLQAKNSRGVSQRPFRIVVGDNISLTPPMGWNSWNSWAAAVDQDKVLRAAKAISASGLAQHGWTYVNIDDSWQGRRGGPFNGIQPNEKFPDMKGLSDQVHSMGLKLGIYSTPWITSYAGFVGGSADNPEGTWDPSQANRQNRKDGKYPFADNDAKQWAAWGIDYLKYDWNPRTSPGNISDEAFHTQVQTMADALKNSGRDVLFSYSNSMPFSAIPQVAPLLNAWRTTGDIRDNWASVNRIGFSQDKWAPFTGPSHWADPDMLVVGYVGWGPKLHPSNLTPNEQYSHISLWALLSAPMLIGADLDRLDDFTISLLSNDEVIDIDQDALGKLATRVSTQDNIDIYTKPLEDGSVAVGLFNRTPFDSKTTVNWADLKLSGQQRVRDLWRQKDVATSTKFTTDVPAHGVMLVKVTPVRYVR